MSYVGQVSRKGQKMATVDNPRKKRVFIASSQADVAEVQKAMQQLGG
jgi:hypothetical protein